MTESAQRLRKPARASAVGAQLSGSVRPWQERRPVRAGSHVEKRATTDDRAVTNEEPPAPAALSREPVGWMAATPRDLIHRAAGFEPRRPETDATGPRPRPRLCPQRAAFPLVAPPMKGVPT
ncbi:hypothetical protein TNCT1_24440 [Streptomyces sp. 1-11]|nr:hypothetical protein TNCT1_24440 [Streptomyces sp. 1-11]